jgi:hypothetical protein
MIDENGIEHAFAAAMSILKIKTITELLTAMTCR